MSENKVVVIEERRGGGVTRRTDNRPWMHKPRTPGVIYQNMFSSPRLAEWFAAHDERIDADLAAWELEEYLKLVREHRAYLRKKRAMAAKASSRSKRRAK